MLIMCTWFFIWPSIQPITHFVNQRNHFALNQPTTEADLQLKQLGVMMDGTLCYCATISVCRSAARDKGSMRTAVFISAPGAWSYINQAPLEGPPPVVTEPLRDGTYSCQS